MLRPPPFDGSRGIRSGSSREVSYGAFSFILTCAQYWRFYWHSIVVAFKGHDDWIRQLCTGHHSGAMVCNTLRRVRYLAVHAVIGCLKQQHVVTNYGYACDQNEFSQVASRKCSIQTVVLFHHDGKHFGCDRRTPLLAFLEMCDVSSVCSQAIGVYGVLIWSQ